LPERFNRLLAPALPAPSDVNVGDRVLFGKWSGIEVKIDGQEPLIEGRRHDGVIAEVPRIKKKAA
jgi:chaperonin GroES